jgi:alpha-beta hydrolase superfamily lysophospholipase
MYAHEGERRSQIDALWLNSAFLDWNLPEWRKVQLHLAAAAGRYYPFLNDPKAFKPDYTRALLTEWEFDTRLKPEYGFPLYYGWLGAISDAFEKVHRGLAIQCPVLSMHSDEADVVLNWKHIAKWSRSARPARHGDGFPGALHDLICSPAHPRGSIQAAFRLGGTKRSVSSVAAAHAT